VRFASLTTLEVGGPIRTLRRCATVAELQEALADARDAGSPVFVLGGGSNLLVSDDGWDGVVVQVDDTSLVFEEEDDGGVLVRAGAGLDWDRLVAAAVDSDLAGLECLSGIPGRVGAAPIQNVGAYGQEVAGTIEAVEVVDLATGELRRLAAADCGFAYRQSRFKNEWRGRYAVVRVDFRLRRGAPGAVRYPELERRFAGTSPSLAEIRAAVLDIRRSKSMVLDPGDPNRRSAGSFFVNPVVSETQAAAVRERLGDPAMPAYPAEGGVKLSAAWLIERAGFRRGDRRGRAGISSRHALALVNLGGATAAEIVSLASEIRKKVREASGVTLVPEPVFLGFRDELDVLLG